MYANSFSVRIPEGNEHGGYVELEHDTQYTLVLRNNRDVSCDARVEVDGKHLGTFRLGAHQNLRLERPAHDDGRFTFYKVGTKEAEQAELDESDPNLGLVKVTFTPEKKCQWTWTYDGPSIEAEWPNYRTYYCTNGSTASDSNIKGSTVSMDAMRSASCDSYAPGGTGLSGKSNQEFFKVHNLDYDYTQQTVIHLRLVAKETRGPRPLTSYSTPVPPPIR